MRAELAGLLRKCRSQRDCIGLIKQAIWGDRLRIKTCGGRFFYYSMDFPSRAGSCRFPEAEIEILALLG